MIKLSTTTAYTVMEAAEILNMNCDTIRRYLRTGKLKGQKVGKLWYVTDRTLTELVTGEKPER